MTYNVSSGTLSFLLTGEFNVQNAADLTSVPPDRETNAEVKDDLLYVIVSHVVSPDEIYVQLASSTAQGNLKRFALHLFNIMTASNTPFLCPANQ